MGWALTDGNQKMAAARSATSAPKALEGDVIDMKGMRTAVVEFAGHTYAIPKDRGQWAIEVMEALEAQPFPRQVRALELILGEEQWKAWRERHKSMEDVDALYAAIGKVTGGNS